MKIRTTLAATTAFTAFTAFTALVGIAAFIAFIGGTVLWSATPAFAHNSPVAYAPAEGSVVTEQPGTFSVTTNEDLLQLSEAGTGMGLQVRGPAGAKHPLYYGDGCVTVSGPTIETKAQLGQPGEYTVIWQVVSTDGHSVSDAYTFTWQPAAGQQLATGSTTPPDCNGTVQVETNQPTDAASRDANASSAGALVDVLWIGGALLAVILAVVVTLVLVRRKPMP
jgi:copper resistance protein C